MRTQLCFVGDLLCGAAGTTLRADSLTSSLRTCTLGRPGLNNLLADGFFTSRQKRVDRPVGQDLPAAGYCMPLSTFDSVSDSLSQSRTGRMFWTVSGQVGPMSAGWHFAVISQDLHSKAIALTGTSPYYTLGFDLWVQVQDRVGSTPVSETLTRQYRPHTRMTIFATSFRTTEGINWAHCIYQISQLNS